MGIGTFFATPHDDGHPTVLVRLEAIGDEELRELITDAWRLKVPKRVRQAHEASLADGGAA